MLETKIGFPREIVAMIEALEHISRGELPNLAASVESGANYFMATWADYAGGGRIPGAGFRVSNARGGYMNSIKKKKINAFHYKVWSDSEVGVALEEGKSNVDLKSFFERSEKRREKKDGGWYLTIPFRHNVLKLMGLGVNTKTLWGMTFSRIKGYQAAKKGKGNVIPVRNGKIRKYKWGTRLKVDNGLINGLTRMKGLTMKIGGKTVKQTGGYMTFRRVSDKSPEDSWFIKQWPKGGPKPVFKFAIKNTKKEIMEGMMAGLEMDIKMAFTGKQ